MVANHKFIDIVHAVSLKGDTLEGVYRRIQDRELFLVAYSNLYANTGATTAGMDPADTVDGMSLDRIETIIERLRTNSYRWQPVKRTYLDKESGGKRPIGIPPWTDKLLQEVIRMVLDAYYDPRFSNNSHGFRPKRGCHTALSQIAHTWSGTKWFIEGDIRKCFDEIRHGVLLDILARDIQDNRFLRLIRTMLKAGYMENWEYHTTYSGTPQGGVASPILANIVLNELDRFVEDELIPEYSRGQKRARNSAYERLNRHLTQAYETGNRAAVKAFRKARQGMPSQDPYDPEYRRLRYCRYADDTLLGFIGPREEAEEIKHKFGSFLDKIGLSMSEEKTWITHAATERARFLGYDITVATARERPRVNGGIRLLVPPGIKTKWMRKYTQQGKPHHRVDRLEMTDLEIVRTYGGEFDGIVNYYTMAENVSQVFYPIKDAAIQSAVKTLASKHKTTASRIYRKYLKQSVHGVRALIVEVPNPKDPKKPYTAQLGHRLIRHKRKSHIHDQVWTPKYPCTQLIDRLLADECELCGDTTHVQVHHVRKLADIEKRYKGRQSPPPEVRFMMERRRKTVVVCEACHQAIHAGTYDGKRVN